MTSNEQANPEIYEVLDTCCHVEALPLPQYRKPKAGHVWCREVNEWLSVPLMRVCGFIAVKHLRRLDPAKKKDRETLAYLAAAEAKRAADEQDIATRWREAVTHQHCSTP